ncbi:MAG: hypothetical protein ACKVP0_12880 [Pirellulaceae bacterium]
MANVQRWRFILGLLLCAVGIALFLAAPWVPDYADVSVSRQWIVAVLGLLLLSAGATAAATAPISTGVRRWLWFSAGLALTCLILHVLKILLGDSSVVALVLHRLAPPTFWFASAGCLGFAMLLTADATGVTYRGGKALGFVVLLFVAAIFHAFLTALRGSTEGLFPESELFQFAAILLGIIQIVFLLILSRVISSGP